MKVLAAALRGGGHALTDAEVARLPLEGGLEPLARALAELLVTTFGAAAANPRPPQDA